MSSMRVSLIVSLILVLTAAAFPRARDPKVKSIQKRNNWDYFDPSMIGGSSLLSQVINQQLDLPPLDAEGDNEMGDACYGCCLGNGTQKEDPLSTNNRTMLELFTGVNNTDPMMGRSNSTSTSNSNSTADPCFRCCDNNGTNIQQEEGEEKGPDARDTRERKSGIAMAEEINFEEDRPAGGFNVFEMLQRPKQFSEADITDMQSGRVISPTAMIWREEIKFEEDRPAGGFNVFEMLQRPKQFPEADITDMQEEPFGSFR